jgi:endonuclease-3 related protein
MSASTRSVVLPGWRRIPGPPRDRVKARLLRLYVALARRLGRQRPLPGSSAYEIALGAVLAHGTAGFDAERALAALRARRLLEPRRLMAVPEAALVEIVRGVSPPARRTGRPRSTGSSRLDAHRLRDFTRWLVTRFGGRFHEPRRAPLAALRAELLAVPGLGPETVDAILLHAANRPVFVANAPTRRVLVRHRVIPADADYEAARAFLEAHLPSDPALFREFHALLVEVGKRYCGVSPTCAGCPLRADLGGRAPAGY